VHEGRARASHALSELALAIVKQTNEARTGDHDFSGSVSGQPLSVMAMDMACGAWATVVP
jgi:hypothetical protein